MKLQGKEISGRKPEVVVIPRGDEEPLVFKVGVVSNFEEFDAICNEPKAPVKTNIKTGLTVNDLTDPTYVKQMNEYNEVRSHWMILKSLSYTDGLEWDTVDMKKPETYENYISEFETSGLTVMEVNHITNAIMSVNALDESKFDEARKLFLSNQVEAQATKK